MYMYVNHVSVSMISLLLNKQMKQHVILSLEHEVGGKATLPRNLKSPPLHDSLSS